MPLAVCEETPIKLMSAGEFRSRCLRVMEEVQATGESVVVTKNGKPVVKIVPAGVRARDVFGCLAGVVEIAGGIESPVTSLNDWNALR